VGVWVCGCVGVWVCGCVGVWVCGCVGGWVQCGRECGASMPFDSVAHHEAELCPNIPRACKHSCGEFIFPAEVKERHEWYLCHLRPVECRLGCGVKGLVYSTREAHETNTCPLRLKQCVLGCGQHYPANQEAYHEAPGEWSVCPARLVRCRFGTCPLALARKLAVAPWCISVILGVCVWGGGGGIECCCGAVWAWGGGVACCAAHADKRPGAPC
jgi:hypothetical protein